MNSLIVAPSVEMTNLENLFFELTASTCQLKCKHCYINFFNAKKKNDFLHIDKIKSALSNLKGEKIKYIYLTGGEPMLHPDFNSILRLCLKKASVTIMTNGQSINEKKARFLKKVQDENNLNHEIVFKISLDHFKEKENDDLRGRGSFRKAVCAVQSLAKYDFNPILNIVNYYGLAENELIEGFSSLFSRYGFILEKINFNIIPFFDKYKKVEHTNNLIPKINLDCKTARILSQNGVYNCPLTVNDNRCRAGSDFSSFSKKNYLETEFCKQ